MGKWWRTTSSGKRVLTPEGYRHAYEEWGGTERYKKDRASRNSARRSALRKGIVHKGDNTAIDHKDSNPRHNAPSNLRVMSRSANAARREDSRLKGSKRHAKKRKRV